MPCIIPFRNLSSRKVLMPMFRNFETVLQSILQSLRNWKRPDGQAPKFLTTFPVHQSTIVSYVKQKTQSLWFFVSKISLTGFLIMQEHKIVQKHIFHLIRSNLWPSCIMITVEWYLIVSLSICKSLYSVNHSMLPRIMPHFLVVGKKCSEKHVSCQ